MNTFANYECLHFWLYYWIRLVCFERMYVGTVTVLCYRIVTIKLLSDILKAVCTIMNAVYGAYHITWTEKKICSHWGDVLSNIKCFPRL
jgi:hypothetical protein